MIDGSIARDLYIKANGLQHHLLVRGAGQSRALIMIHGLSGQAHFFDGIAPRLAESFEVYCLDVRGRGDSDWGPADEYHTDTYVSDLESVRAALGLEKISLVGTSMGGFISLYYAARYPERVSRVVLNDIGPEIELKGLERIRNYTGNAPSEFTDFSAVILFYKQHYAGMMARMSEGEIAQFAQWHVKQDARGFFVWKVDPQVRALTMTKPSVDPWDAYKSIRCPVLIIRGALSDVLSANVARRMKAALPQAEFVEVPGASHAPMLTEPEAKQALDLFLRDTGTDT